MSRLPVVAIIGRPNTGKSTLFNRLVGKRIAIENEVAGTTRDHIAHIVEGREMEYLVLDTGGMGGGTEDKDFEDDVHAQSVLALKAADVILFTVDGRTDPTKSDFVIAGMLRKERRRHVPVILVITKCDNAKLEEQARHAFHELAVEGTVITVSATHNVGTDALEEEIERLLIDLKFEKKHKIDPEEKSDIPRIAIIGKPNVGKSSIINALMSDPQRKVSPKLVSDIPGTTRDSTDTIIRHEGQDFLFVDTAGLRRKSNVEFGVESLSMLRTIQSIEECDVAVLVINAEEAVSHQDKKIASMVVERGKSILILMNKVDLLTGEKRKERMTDIKQNFLFCRFAPVIPCSAVTRDGLGKIFDLALMAQRNRFRRIPQKDLLHFFRSAIAGQPMSALQTAKHITQAKDPPPTFVLFVRNPKEVRLSQLRYLDNRLRETFGLEGTPVRWVTRGPRDRD